MCLSEATLYVLCVVCLIGCAILYLCVCRNVIIVLLYLIFIVKSLVVYGRSVYVSNSGEDHQNCGESFNKPCKNIEYAFNNLNGKFNQTIILDGGQSSQMIYHLESTTTLKRNVKFMALQSSRFHPVITKNKSSNFVGFLFSASLRITITFQFIQFVDTLIVECLGSSCHVLLYDCKIISAGNMKKINLPILSLLASQSYTFPRVDIYNCYFNINGELLNYFGQVGLTIKNSTFTNTTIRFTASYCVIENVMFLNYKVERTVLEMNPLKNNSKNTIKNLTFLRIVGPQVMEIIGRNTSIAIMNVHFTNCYASYLQINKDLKLTLTNSSATNCIISKCGFYFQNTNALLKNLHFERNSIVESNKFLVLSITSSLVCTNLTFLNNTGNKFVSPYIIAIMDSTVSITLLKMRRNKLKSLLVSTDSAIKLIQNEINENSVNTAFIFRSSNICIDSISIVNNSYLSGIQFENSNVTIKNIYIAYNSYNRFNKDWERLEEIALIKGKEIYIQSDKSKLSMKNVTVISTELEEYANSNVHLICLKLSLNSIISVQEVHIFMKNYQYNALEINIKIDNRNKLATSTKIQIQINCPEGSNPIFHKNIDISLVGQYSIICIPCDSSSHAVNGGTFLSSSTSDENITDSVASDDFILNKVTCKSCPIGGQCSHGKTKSRGNFFGFKKTFDTIQYIPCPPLHCCSSEATCTSYNTCAPFRQGTLCGTCQHDYQEDFFATAKCIPVENCTSQHLFWILYSLTIISHVIVLMYFDLFFSFLKRTYKMLILKCKQYLVSPSSREIRTEESEQKVIDKNSLPLRKRIINIVPLEHEGLDNSSKDSINSECKSTETTFTISGILSILLAFYQIKSLLRVKTTFKLNTSSRLQEGISSIFNLDALFEIPSTLCPLEKLDNVTRYFIKYFLFNTTMPIIVMVMISIRWLFKNILSKQRRIRSLIKIFTRTFHYRFIYRLHITYLRLLLFVYKNLAFFSFSMVNCVNIKEDNVLFIQGDRKCYQLWQYAVILFLVIWVIPFPFVLWLSYRLFEKKKINFGEMLICLTIPPSTMIYLLRTVCNPSITFDHNPVLAKFVGELFTESYRLKKHSKSQFVFWEHWRLIQRLLLSAITTFFINPLERVCYVSPCVLLFIVVYWKVKPYKPTLKLLHWCEVASLMSFCFLLVVNVFEAFFYIYNVTIEDPIPSLKIFFSWMDWICSPMTVMVIYFVIIPLCEKSLKYIRKCIS